MSKAFDYSAARTNAAIGDESADVLEQVGLVDASDKAIYGINDLLYKFAAKMEEFRYSWRFLLKRIGDFHPEALAKSIDKSTGWATKVEDISIDLLPEVATDAFGIMMNEIMAENISMKKELEEANHKRGVLVDEEVRRLRELLGERDLRISDMEEQLRVANGEVQKASEVVDKFEQHAIMLYGEDAAIKDRFDDLVERNPYLACLTLYEERTDKLVSKLEKAELHAKSLEGSVEKGRAYVEKLRDKLSRTESKVLDRDRSLDLHEKTIDDLQNSLGKARDRIKREAERKDELLSRFDNLSENYMTLQKWLSSSKRLSLVRLYVIAALSVALALQAYAWRSSTLSLMRQNLKTQYENITK